MNFRQTFLTARYKQTAQQEAGPQKRNTWWYVEMVMSQSIVDNEMYY